MDYRKTSEVTFSFFSFLARYVSTSFVQHSLIEGTLRTVYIKYSYFRHAIRHVTSIIFPPSKFAFEKRVEKQSFFLLSRLIIDTRDIHFPSFIRFRVLLTLTYFARFPNYSQWRLVLTCARANSRSSSRGNFLIERRPRKLLIRRFSARFKVSTRLKAHNLRVRDKNLFHTFTIIFPIPIAPVLFVSRCEKSNNNKSIFSLGKKKQQKVVKLILRDSASARYFFF